MSRRRAVVFLARDGRTLSRREWVELSCDQGYALLVRTQERGIVVRTEWVGAWLPQEEPVPRPYLSEALTEGGRVLACVWSADEAAALAAHRRLVARFIDCEGR